MGLYSKTLLFAFLNFSVIYGENLCPVSFCGSSMLTIHHPFKLENKIPTNNCTYFNLTCYATQNEAIVNLPYSGDFYVQNIDYVRRHIQLYDPGNCLTRRLMNFSLASSPYMADYYVNYTFYVCPLDSQGLGSHVNPIGCLSNSTNITVATQELSREFMEGYGCRTIGSWSIPVSGLVKSEDDGFYDDRFLFLTWDVNACKDCEETDYQDSGKGGAKSITKIVAIALSMPALIIVGLSCCSIFCFHFLRMMGDKQETDSAAASSTTMETPQTAIGIGMQPPSTASDACLDESQIMACTEIVVPSESADSYTCSICLESYCQKETIRQISKCGHCFHESCIQQWLGKNSTCPVCRTSLSDVAL